MRRLATLVHGGVSVPAEPGLQLLRAAGPDSAPWTRRELLVLEMLAAAHP